MLDLALGVVKARRPWPDLGFGLPQKRRRSPVLERWQQHPGPLELGLQRSEPHVVGCGGGVPVRRWYAAGRDDPGHLRDARRKEEEVVAAVVVVRRHAVHCGAPAERARAWPMRVARGGSACTARGDPGPAALIELRRIAKF
jgi:hypothetical protein